MVTGRIHMPAMAVLTVVFVGLFAGMAWPGGFYFLNDDFVHIPLAAGRHFSGGGTLLRPVSDLTLWMDHLLWGKNAFGYHLTNVLIHLVNTALVWLLGRRLYRDYGDPEAAGLKAWLAAMFFLLYAFHSEPVFWIIGRGGSLGTLFFLSSCLFYMRRHAGRWYFILSLLSFAVGLLVYETIWIFPLIAVLFSMVDIYGGARGVDGEDEGKHAGTTNGRIRNGAGGGGGGKNWKIEIRYPAWVAALFVVYLLLRRSQAGSLVGNYEGGHLLGADLFKLFYNYNALLARSFLPPMADPKWFAGCYVIVLALLGGALFYIFRRGKQHSGDRAAGGLQAVWLVACFLVALLPAVSLGIDTHTTESERFIYLSSVFCVLLVVEIVSLLTAGAGKLRPGGGPGVKPGGARMLTCWMLLIILVHGYGLWQSSEDYRYGGMVARQSLAFVKGVSDGGVVYVIHPPSQYRGALIFRYGFEPAFRWICPECVYTKMVEIGQQRLSRRRDSLSCVEGGGGPGGGRMVLTDTVSGPRVVLPDTSFNYSPGKDVIFYWTDSSLVRIR